MGDFSPQQKRLFDAIRKMKADGFDDARIKEAVDYAVKKDPSLAQSPDAKPQGEFVRPLAPAVAPEEKFGGALGQMQEQGIKVPTAPTAYAPEQNPDKGSRLEHILTAPIELIKEGGAGFDVLGSYLPGTIDKRAVANYAIEEEKAKRRARFPDIESKSGLDVFKDPTDIDAWTKAASSVAPSALMMFTGPVGAGAVLPSYFGSSVQSGYKAGLDAGLTDNQSIAFGTILGSIEAGTEMIGLEGVTKLIPKQTLNKWVVEAAKKYGKEGVKDAFSEVIQKIAKSRLGRAVGGGVTGAAIEGGEEALNSLGQSATELAFDKATGSNLFDPNNQVGDGFMNTAGEVLSRAGRAGAEGAVGGFLLGAPYGALSRGQQPNQPQPQQPNEPTPPSDMPPVNPVDGGTPPSAQLTNQSSVVDFIVRNIVSSNTKRSEETGQQTASKMEVEQWAKEAEALFKDPNQALEYVRKKNEEWANTSPPTQPTTATEEALTYAEDLLGSLVDEPMPEEDVVPTPELTPAQKRAREAHAGYVESGLYDEPTLAALLPVMDALEALEDDIANNRKAGKLDKYGLHTDIVKQREKEYKVRKTELQKQLKDIASGKVATPPVDVTMPTVDVTTPPVDVTAPPVEVATSPIDLGEEDVTLEEPQPEPVVKPRSAMAQDHVGKSVTYNGQVGTIIDEGNGKYAIETESQIVELDPKKPLIDQGVRVFSEKKQDAFDGDVSVISETQANVNGIPYEIVRDNKGNAIYLTNGQDVINNEDAMVKVDIQSNRLGLQELETRAAEATQTPVDVVSNVNQVMSANMTDRVANILDNGISANTSEADFLALELYVESTIRDLEDMFGDTEYAKHQIEVLKEVQQIADNEYDKHEAKRAKERSRAERGKKSDNKSNPKSRTKAESKSKVKPETKEPTKQTEKKDEKEPVLEGVSSGGNEGEGRKESAELRTQEPKQEKVEDADNFTNGNDLQRIREEVKSKYGEKQGASILDVAYRLVNPNKHNIVGIKSNGVYTKQGDKILFHPFSNTDSNKSKWTLASPIDATDTFKPTEQAPTSTESKAAVESSPTIEDFAALEAKGVQGRKLRDELAKRIGKDKIAEMRTITTKFESIITALEDQGKITKKCP